MLCYLKYLKRGHGSPQSLKMWRLNCGPITACLLHRVTTRTYVHISPWHLVQCINLSPIYKCYTGACVGLPNPTIWQINLSSLKWDQITQSAAIRWFRHRRYTYPPGRPGCNPRGDRTNKNV